jgi:hypothetical protein
MRVRAVRLAGGGVLVMRSRGYGSLLLMNIRGVGRGEEDGRLIASTGGTVLVLVMLMIVVVRVGGVVAMVGMTATIAAWSSRKTIVDMSRSRSVVHTPPLIILVLSCRRHALLGVVLCSSSSPQVRCCRLGFRTALHRMMRDRIVLLLLNVTSAYFL